MNDLLQIFNERILTYGGLEKTAVLIETEMNTVYTPLYEHKPFVMHPNTKYENIKAKEFLKILNS